jgi:hypothetical protein
VYRQPGVVLEQPAVTVLRVLLPLAGLALFAGLLQHADLRDLGRHLAHVGAAGFGAVLAVHALSFLCDVVLWQLGFPPAAATRSRHWTWYRVRLVGEAWNNALPLASVGGEPLKAKLLKEIFDLDYTASGAAFLIAKTANLIALGDPRFAAGYQLTAGLGLAVFAVGCWLVWLAQQGRLARLLNALTPTAKRGAPSLLRFVAAVEDFDAALLAGYRASPRRTLVILALAFLTWIAGVWEIQIILVAVGSPIGFTDAWMIEAAAQLVRAAAFFVPSGLGVVDGSFVLVTTLVTCSTPLGFLVAVVRRARDLAWIGLGFVAGLRLGGSAARAAP